MNETQLNSQQLEAVSHRDGPMIVLSCVGSGKTTVLTERIMRLLDEGANPANLLAITFAKKAVTEIISRLEERFNGAKDKATVCTFHSLGYRILKAEGYPISGFRVIQENEQMDLLFQAMEGVKETDEPATLLNKISLAKNDIKSPMDLEKSKNLKDKITAKVYQNYEVLKRRKRMVDFDDLLYLSHSLFSKDKKALKYYQRRFHYILVDEFQDSSKVMVELVNMLSKPEQNIWLAGDDDQSIYSFRGARPDIFVSLDREYGDSTKSITMSHNYRSTKNIIKAANNLISHNQERIKKEMITDNEEGEEIQILEAEDEITEAESIVEKILELKESGYRNTDIAILARVHILMPFIEAFLIKQEIPYNGYGGFLYNRRDIRMVINVLKYLIYGQKTKDLEVDLIREIMSKLSFNRDTLSLIEVFDVAGSYIMMKSGSVVDDDKQTLRSLYLDAFQYLMIPYRSLREFLRHIKEAKEINNRSFGKVTITTIHQAKGLQFQCVIIPGVNEGILPHANANSSDQQGSIEEERRLMYVASTRAMKRLIVTYRRHQIGKPTTMPSRFIYELSAQSK